MDRLVPIIARLIVLNPKKAASDTFVSAMLMAGVGLLFLTFWVASIAGVTLFLARSIGMVPSVFTIGGVALLTSFCLLVWVRLRVRSRRRERRVEVERRQIAIASALAALPRKKASRAFIVLAGVVVLAVLASKPKRESNDGT